MSNATQLLILSLVLYFVSLLLAFLLRAGLNKYRRTWFAIPYDRLPIGIALVLLVLTTGAYATGNEKTSDDIAVMAYYLLVLGVVLQIMNCIREQRAEERIRISVDEDLGSRSIGEDQPSEDE